MIAVRLDGRLGNQLFQYAFGVAASRRLGTGLLIDDSAAGFRLPAYFRLTPADHLGQLVRGKLGKTVRRGYRRLVAGAQGFSVVQQDDWAPPSEQPPLSDKQLHVGFYQSARYFEGQEQALRELFTVRGLHRDRFRAHYGDFFDRQRTVVLHVRRGDYLRWNVPRLGGADLTLPWSYYERCLGLVPDLAAHQIVAVTDDPQWVRERLAPYPGARIESASEIVDFQALAAADVAILSPSSFSWWAAWLNPKPHKRVLAPARWLGFKGEEEYPAGVLCPGWRTVEVDG